MTCIDNKIRDIPWREGCPEFNKAPLTPVPKYRLAEWWINMRRNHGSLSFVMYQQVVKWIPIIAVHVTGFLCQHGILVIWINRKICICRTYIYVILLLKLFTIDSGCHRNTYMTAAQLRLANAGHAFSCILERASGVIREDSECIFGWTERLAMARTTRAKT